MTSFTWLDTNEKYVFIDRIDQLIAIDLSTGDRYAAIVEAHAGAVTIAAEVYGLGRPQLQMLVDIVKKANTEKHGIPSHNYLQIVWPVVLGTLRSMKADIQPFEWQHFGIDAPAGYVGKLDHRLERHR